jgi:predicted AAA+ superfamily ATPase
MKRIYDVLLEEHLKNHRQMAFLSGARQVGKTTSSRAGVGVHDYLIWDNPSHRALYM